MFLLIKNLQFSQDRGVEKNYGKKDPFPVRVTPSGLGAKCLSAVVLDNQDRALTSP